MCYTLLNNCCPQEASAPCPDLTMKKLLHLSHTVLFGKEWLMGTSLGPHLGPHLSSLFDPWSSDRCSWLDCCHRLRPSSIRCFFEPLKFGALRPRVESSWVRCPQYCTMLQLACTQDSTRPYQFVAMVPTSRNVMYQYLIQYNILYYIIFIILYNVMCIHIYIYIYTCIIIRPGRMCWPGKCVLTAQGQCFMRLSVSSIWADAWRKFTPSFLLISTTSLSLSLSISLSLSLSISLSSSSSSTTTTTTSSATSSASSSLNPKP